MIVIYYFDDDDMVCYTLVLHLYVDKSSNAKEGYLLLSIDL